MSTMYQVLSDDMRLTDIEQQNRIYVSRDLYGIPQFDTIYEIFKVSMFSRLKGQATILIALIIMELYYFDVIIEYLYPMIILAHKMPSGYSVVANANAGLNSSTANRLYNEFQESHVGNLAYCLEMIMILSLINLSFGLTQIIKVAIIRILNKISNFPNNNQILDLTISGLSVYIFIWAYNFKGHIEDDKVDLDVVKECLAFPILWLVAGISIAFFLKLMEVI